MINKKDIGLRTLGWNLRTVRLANRLGLWKMARILGIRVWQLWLLERGYCPEVSCEFLICFDRYFDAKVWEMLEKPLLKRKKNL